MCVRLHCEWRANSKEGTGSVTSLRSAAWLPYTLSPSDRQISGSLTPRHKSEKLGAGARDWLVDPQPRRPSLAFARSCCDESAPPWKIWTYSSAFAALFGSAARGNMRPDSDIDLFVVRPGEVHADSARWAEQLTDLSERLTACTGCDARALELSAVEGAG